MSASVFLYLSSHWYLYLGLHNTLKVSFGHDQTKSTYVEQAFLRLVLPLHGRVYHRSKLDPSLWKRNSKGSKHHVAVLQEQTKYDLSTKETAATHALNGNLSKHLPSNLKTISK
jgi:hypothetical protein